MRILALCSAAALALAFAPNANATIVGSTYNLTTSETGNTVITPLGAQGAHTDPANPGFCVGSTEVGPACASGSGVTGSYAFSTVSPTLDRISFSFAGSTAGAGPGTFDVELGNFTTTDGETVTGVSYLSGNFIGGEGDFSSVSFVGGNATFTGSTSTDFDALGGTTVTFNVTTAQAVPAPLIGHGLLAFLAVGGILFGAKFLQRSRNPEAAA
jgi:hypothetical protein